MTGLKTFLARLWPKGLMGQTVLLVLIALFSAQWRCAPKCWAIAAWDPPPR